MEKTEISFVDDGPEECLLRCAETISGIGEVIIQFGSYEIDLSKNAWAALGRVQEFLGKVVEALGEKYYGAIQDAHRNEPVSMARRSEQGCFVAKRAGDVQFMNVNVVRNVKGNLVVVNRNGALDFLNDRGEHLIYPLVYGAILKVENGQHVESGAVLAEWDPFNIPIIAEVHGIAKFGDVILGKTMKEELDPITGKISRVIVEYKDADMRPCIFLKDDEGNTLRLPSSKYAPRYLLPVGAIITVTDGLMVNAGDVLAKIPCKNSEAAAAGDATAAR